MTQTPKKPKYPTRQDVLKNPKPKPDDERLAFAVRVLKKAREKERGLGPDKVGKTAVWIAATNLIDSLPLKVKLEALKIARAADSDGISRVGRRAELEATGTAGDVIIKVSVAGSGYGNWRTEREKDDFVPTKDTAGNWGWAPIDDLTTGDCVCYERNPTSATRAELLFAGPGGFNTKGSKGGVLDRGTNTIDKLEKEVIYQVKRLLEGTDPNDDKHITLLIRAHSRGAVAADVAAKFLKMIYGDRMTVELVAIEPVPGPGHTGMEERIQVGDLDESTVVYSLSPEKNPLGNPLFASQRVDRAKRIILTTQNHSAGLSEGFVYNKQRYTGSAMNSLPEGIYLDTNKTAESSIVLEQVSSLANFHEALQRQHALDEHSGLGLQTRPRPGRQREADLKKALEKRKEATAYHMGNEIRLTTIDIVLRNYLKG
jgi:hypothetical protein